MHMIQGLTHLGAHRHRVLCAHQGADVLCGWVIHRNPAVAIPIRDVHPPVLADCDLDCYVMVTTNRLQRGQLPDSGILDSTTESCSF
jgi:hypothetical protein